MMPIVCKFGGSSLADAGQFRKVKAVVEAEPRRRFVVPSAPGRRFPEDTKLTDLFYSCHQAAAKGISYEHLFSHIRERYLDIERALRIDAQMSVHLERLYRQLGERPSQDFAASRGEYLSGLLLAKYLNAEFVDPSECVTIDDDGTVTAACYTALGERLCKDSERFVIPGFYGKDHHSNVRTFSRGGSDITGSIVARAVGAELYENWTDVSGLLMADPRIVDEPRPMQEVTYREIRELSYMGASVLHDEAISPLREVGIPINIRNLQLPEHPGTRIVDTLSPNTIATTEIAGIAGKDDFSIISVSKNLMNKDQGFAHRLLGILDRHQISFEHCPSSIDSMSVIIHRSELGDKAPQVLSEIRKELTPDSVDFAPQVALIAVVGEEMAQSIGIAAKVFTALRDAQVNVRVINQGASELNIIVGVRSSDYESATRALYNAFVG